MGFQGVPVAFQVCSMKFKGHSREFQGVSGAFQAFQGVLEEFQGLSVGVLVGPSDVPWGCKGFQKRSMLFQRRCSGFQGVSGDF